MQSKQRFIWLIFRNKGAETWLNTSERRPSDCALHALEILPAYTQPYNLQLRLSVNGPQTCSQTCKKAGGGGPQ